MDTRKGWMIAVVCGGVVPSVAGQAVPIVSPIRPVSPADVVALSVREAPGLGHLVTAEGPGGEPAQVGLVCCEGGGPWVRLTTDPGATYGEAAGFRVGGPWLLATRDDGVSGLSARRYAAGAPSSGTAVWPGESVAVGLARADGSPDGTGVLIKVPRTGSSGTYWQVLGTPISGGADPQPLSAAGLDVSEVSFAPEGDLVVYTSGSASDEVRMDAVWRVAGAPGVAIEPPIGTTGHFPAVNPGPACPTCVAFVASRLDQTSGDVVVVDVATGVQVVVFSGGGVWMPAFLSWSPDGSMLSFVRSVSGHGLPPGEPELVVVRVPQPLGAPPTPAGVVSPSLSGIHSLVWSEDGQRVGFVGVASVAGGWTSRAYEVRVCYANCDGSTGAPALTPADFVCFLNRYRSGSAEANCDGSTGTPALTPSDFVCFLNQYRAGCL